MTDPPASSSLFAAMPKDGLATSPLVVSLPPHSRARVRWLSGKGSRFRLVVSFLWLDNVHLLFLWMGLI